MRITAIIYYSGFSIQRLEAESLRGKREMAPGRGRGRWFQRDEQLGRRIFIKMVLFRTSLRIYQQRHHLRYRSIHLYLLRRLAKRIWGRMILGHSLAHHIIFRHLSTTISIKRSQFKRDCSFLAHILQEIRSNKVKCYSVVVGKTWHYVYSCIFCAMCILVFL